jgi:hypothetical protein
MIVVMPRNAIKTLVNLLEPVTQTYQKESPEHNKAKKIKIDDFIQFINIKYN